MDILKYPSNIWLNGVFFAPNDLMMTNNYYYFKHEQLIINLFINALQYALIVMGILLLYCRKLPHKCQYYVFYNNQMI